MAPGATPALKATLAEADVGKQSPALYYRFTYQLIDSMGVPGDTLPVSAVQQRCDMSHACKFHM